MKGYVYCLYDHFNKITRIGRTRRADESRQRGQMGYYHGELVCMTFEVEDYYAVETDLHKLFENHHKKGDWFYISCLDVFNAMCNDKRCISAITPTPLQFLKITCQNDRDNSGIKKHNFTTIDAGRNNGRRKSALKNQIK